MEGKSVLGIESGEKERNWRQLFGGDFLLRVQRKRVVVGRECSEKKKGGFFGFLRWERLQ